MNEALLRIAAPYKIEDAIRGKGPEHRNDRLLPPVEVKPRDVRHVFSDVVNDVS